MHASGDRRGDRSPNSSQRSRRRAVRGEVQSGTGDAARRPRRRRLNFDCASIGEVALVRQMFPNTAIHFMHPVKPRGAIREASAQHGVRDFVLDSTEELAKSGANRQRPAWVASSA